MVHSGSSETFISDKVVQKLQLPTVSISPLEVILFDGRKLMTETDKAVTHLSWWIQGHNFASEAKVLPLGCYDLILGMDLLEQFSTMWVHWKRKKMRFNHDGQRITLT
jgi:hypothetical protein